MSVTRLTSMRGIQALRRSIKGEKDKPNTASISHKSAIAIVPPKMVSFPNPPRFCAAGCRCGLVLQAETIMNDALPNASTQGAYACTRLSEHYTTMKQDQIKS
jgi:hypothetical protein